MERVDRFKTFIDTNIRKVAHFLEFGLLGIEAAVLLLLAYGKGKVRPSLPAPLCKVARSFLFPVTVAFCDESIQLLSSRGPSVLDMWIDIIGYLCFFILTYVVLIFIGKKKTA